MALKKLKRIKSTRFWRKGSGELLGFVIIAPFIILLICFIIAATQISITNQNLTFAAYNCGRAAVISETYNIAEKKANEIYLAEMGDVGSDAAHYSFIPCELEVLNGEEWEKGSYVKCTVRYYISTMMPFTSGVREQSIVMMIENGDLDK